MCLYMGHLKNATGDRSTRALSFWIKVEFGSVGFFREGKMWEPREKHFGVRREPTTNSTHIWHWEQELNPSHWWKASALTTAPPLLPNLWFVKLDVKISGMQQSELYWRPHGFYFACVLKQKNENKTKFCCP